MFTYYSSIIAMSILHCFRSSVRPSVCFHCYLLSHVTFDLDFLHVIVHYVQVIIIARRGLKIKVKGQGQELGLELELDIG